MSNFFTDLFGKKEPEQPKRPIRRGKYYAKDLGKEHDYKLYSFSTQDQAYSDLYKAESTNSRDLANEIYTILLGADPLGIFLMRTKANGSCATWKLKRRIDWVIGEDNAYSPTKFAEILNLKLYRNNHYDFSETLSFQEVKVIINHIKGAEKIVERQSSPEFELEMQGLYMLESDKLELERLRQEGIDWLVDNGVSIDLINTMIEKKTLGVASIEDAKREYLRLIEMCEFDNANFEAGLDSIKRDFDNTNDHNKLETRMRTIIIANIDKHTDEELKIIINKTFNKVFNFSYTRSYEKANGTIVAAYVRILFKN